MKCAHKKYINIYIKLDNPIDFVLQQFTLYYNKLSPHTESISMRELIDMGNMAHLIYESRDFVYSYK